MDFARFESQALARPPNVEMRFGDRGETRRNILDALGTGMMGQERFPLPSRDLY